MSSLSELGKNLPALCCQGETENSCPNLQRPGVWGWRSRKDADHSAVLRRLSGRQPGSTRIQTRALVSVQNIFREEPRQLASAPMEPPLLPAPGSLPRPPPALLPSPHPPPPASDPLIGWAGQGRTRGGPGAGPPSLHCFQKPDHCFGKNVKRSGKIRSGSRTCLRLWKSDPVPGAACPRGCRSAKASYLQPEPSELLGMPSPTAKTCRSSSVSISIIQFLQAAVTGGFYRRFYL